MVIISATGGSGSSFVADEFRRHFWNVCLRPDGGHQKATHTPAQIFLERTRPFYTPWANDDITQKEMFNQAYQNLKGLGWSNIMLLCMSWGGLGFLNNLEEKPIFLVEIQFLPLIHTLEVVGEKRGVPVALSMLKQLAQMI